MGNQTLFNQLNYKMKTDKYFLPKIETAVENIKKSQEEKKLMLVEQAGDIGMDGGEAYREERAVFESEYLFFDFNSA